MRMIMEFQADNGKIFNNAESAAHEEHRERIGLLAHDICREENPNISKNSDFVGKVANLLIIMEMYGFEKIAETIENSRNKAEQDAAEFARENSAEDDE